MKVSYCGIQRMCLYRPGIVVICAGGASFGGRLGAGMGVEGC